MPKPKVDRYAIKTQTVRLPRVGSKNDRRIPRKPQ